MAGRRPGAVFFVANVLVWLLMIVIMVVVPDTLESWTSFEVGRVVGWAVASGVWVVVLQQRWRDRVGPLGLFLVQFVLWVSAAMLASWVSAVSRPF